VIMKLIEITAGAYYLSGATNLGVVATPGGGAVLIDTGQDKDQAKRLLKACEAAGLTPRAIINTHGHADHFGSNEYVVRKTGVPTYAPPFEEAFITYPYLEPFYLFSGARPIAPLQTKWLLGGPSRVEQIIEGGTLEVEGLAFQVLSFPGHAHGQVALGWGEVLYCADALFGGDVLARYGLPYATDVGAQIQSIKRLQATKFKHYLPGHGPLTDDIRPLCVANLDAIERGLEAVLQATSSTSETTKVVTKASQALGIVMINIPQYYLFKSIIKAYLSYLVEEGQVVFTLEENRLLWQRV